MGSSESESESEELCSRSTLSPWHRLVAGSGRDRPDTAPLPNVQCWPISYGKTCQTPIRSRPSPLFPTRAIAPRGSIPDSFLPSFLPDPLQAALFSRHLLSPNASFSLVAQPQRQPRPEALPTQPSSPRRPKTRRVSPLIARGPGRSPRHFHQPAREVRRLTRGILVLPASRLEQKKSISDSNLISDISKPTDRRGLRNRFQTSLTRQGAPKSNRLPEQ